MAWTEKVKELEEKLSEACAAFDGHDATLVFAAKLPRKDEDVRAEVWEAMQPLQQRPDVTMLARLKLPVLDHGDLLVEVSLDGPEAARSRFAELVGMAGLLIPSNVQAELDRHEPAQGRMTERGRFLAWLWRLESTRLAGQDEQVWMDLGDGSSFVFGIREPFRLARLVLRCFQDNPGGQFVLPVVVGASPARKPTVEDASATEAKVSRPLNEPSKEDFAAYRLYVVAQMKQGRVAKELTAEFHKPFDQGGVSRRVKRVRAFLKAGGVMPELEQGNASVASVDPAVIEMGARQDGQTCRQRMKSADDGE